MPMPVRRRAESGTVNGQDDRDQHRSDDAGGKAVVVQVEPGMKRTHCQRGGRMHDVELRHRADGSRLRAAVPPLR
jgi:hypothetical protein